MASLTLRNVGAVAQTPLFSNLSLTIGERDRLALVAGNGAGKSTLIRCLAGIAEPTSGDIVRARGMRVGLVEQDVPADLLDVSLHEALCRALPVAERHGNEWRADMVLADFEAPPDLHHKPLRELSGGWQRLALIARAWITEPDALLLDEPTNHLDLEKLLLLERWIRDIAGSIPVVVASHDRDFLDACTTRTLFLRPEQSIVYDHPYRMARALLAEHDAAMEARFEKDFREAKRLRQNAGELRNIGINSGSDLLLRKAKQLGRRASVIEDRMQAAHQERSGEIRLGNRGTHAKVLVRLENVAVTTPDSRPLFVVPKLEVEQGDRIVVLGRNGIGKSQLVRLLRGAMAAPDASPGIRISPSLALGYVDQDMSQLPGKETALGFILSAFRLGDQRSKAVLANAGFSIERQRQPIATMSPGQKARLGLLALRLSEPNFYLLDEPTNHVDIPGREQLEAEILASEATAIIVSHDRSFVNAIGTRFLLAQERKVREIESPEVFYRSLAG